MSGLDQLLNVCNSFGYDEFNRLTAHIRDPRESPYVFVALFASQRMNWIKVRRA
jgi:hypothetical protein